MTAMDADGNEEGHLKRRISPSPTEAFIEVDSHHSYELLRRSICLGRF